VKAIESILIAEAQKEQASKAASKAAAKEASKAAARPPVAPRQRTGETGSAYIKRLKLLFADDSGGGSDDDSTTADDDSDLESVGPGGVGDDSDDDDGDDNDGGDDDGDLTVLYGHDSRRKTAAVKEQQVRYAELSKAMKTKEAEIKRMAARLQLAETAAQQRHQARSSGNQAWSVVDESENDDDDDDDDDSENEDTGGIACRDIGDLNPTEHPDRLTVTESRVLHDDAARTQSATLYRNYSIKLQIQGFLDQLLVLKRAVAVLRINKKRVDRVIKAGCVDTDLPNARTSMRHELEHLHKAVKVLQGKIQGATIADDCVKPEDAQMLIEKRWAMSGKRASKLLTVVKEVHDSHAFLKLLPAGRGGGGDSSFKRGGGAGGGGGGGGDNSHPDKPGGGKGKGKKGTWRKKGRGGGQGSSDP